MLPRLLFLVAVLALLAGGGYAASRVIAHRQPVPRATALIAALDPRGAQLILRPLLRQDPRNAEAHVLLARTQLDLNDPVAAEKELKIARALRYERAVLNPLLGRAYLMQQRYLDVLADIPGTAVREEELAPNLATRAVAYLQMGDLRQAELSLEGAQAIAPDNLDVKVAQVRYLIARNELARARGAAVQLLVEQPGNLEAMLLEADTLDRLGDRPASLAAMDRALARAPYFVPARLQRANLLMALDRNADAQKDVDAAFDVDWHDPAVLMNNAILMIRAGRLGDASTEFQRLAPQLDRYPKGYYWQALTASMLDQNESALEMLYRYLKIAPADRDALRLAARLETKAGRPDRAIDILARSTRAGTRDAESFDILGRAYFVQGRIADSVDSYRNATRLAPANTDYAAHLAAAETLAATAARISTPAAIGAGDDMK